MKFSNIAACLLSLSHLSYSQRFTTAATSTLDPVQDPNTVASSTLIPLATPSGPGEPCAQVSSLQASYLSANPRATIGPRIPATLAYDCTNSAPFVQRDARQLLDGILAMIEFQSTLDFTNSPPSSYPVAPVDLVSELNAILDRVNSNGYESELQFETALVTVLASVHDGHLNFVPDGMTVFQYGQQFGPLVSISRDGTAAPELFLYREMSAFLNGQGPSPSAIDQINGVDATEFILNATLNSTIAVYQDADAMYNAYLWSPNLGDGAGTNPGLFSGSIFGLLRDSTSIRFANGSVLERANIAITGYDFDGVHDGESFYDTFCNADRKGTGLRRRDAQAVPTLETYHQMWKHGGYWQQSKANLAARQASNTGRPAAYPDPEILSSDGSLAGYFLAEAGFEDVAVLLIRSFSISAVESFQSTLTSFLDSCRANNKRRLIIDMSGNPGGVVGLGYDTFKQLFPTLEPWDTGNFRAHRGFQLLGEAVTDLSSYVLRQSPNDYDAFEQAFGTTAYASETKLTVNGTVFEDFANFYGPVAAPGNRGSYTNQFRLDLDNPDFSESISGIVISGYDSSRPLAPQPFESQNMIILTDGQCSSTCAMISHLLKWQGKVKSVAMGGRPQTGPMQAVGGVKGSQVQTFLQLYAIAAGTYLVSPDATRQSWANSTLATVLQDGEYLLLRTRSVGQIPGEVSFNIQNNIAEGDRSLTPLQFVYEAADCRLYYQPQHIRDVSTRWNAVSAQAFGLNGTDVFSGCVSDSTNHPSSLSGDPALYNNGIITNVTSETRDYNNANAGGSGASDNAGGQGSGGGGGGNAANVMAAVSPLLITLASLITAFMYVI